MSWDSPPIFLKRRPAGAPAIAYRVFRPGKPASVSVLMAHGYFENMKRYREVIERWNAQGILVAIYDLRGHGLSGGSRGCISRFEEYIDDEESMLAELATDDAWKALAPPMLFGHSLGGLISIHTAFEPPTRSAGSRCRRLTSRSCKRYRRSSSSSASSSRVWCLRYRWPATSPGTTARTTPPSAKRTIAIP